MKSAAVLFALLLALLCISHARANKVAVTIHDRNHLVEGLRVTHHHVMHDQRRLIHNLKKEFKAFDLNGDGAIDHDEIQKAVDDGHISPIAARVMKAVDLNKDKKITFDEFKKQPLFYALLQTQENVELNDNTENIDDAVFLQVQQEFERAAKPVSIDHSMRFRSLAGAGTQQFGFGSMLGAAGGSALGGMMGGSTGAMIGAATGGLMGSALGSSSSSSGRCASGMGSNGAACDPSLDPNFRPTSKWGIPSYEDEGCVMCQYLIQRIQYNLDSSSQMDPTGLKFDNNDQKTAYQMKKKAKQLVVAAKGERSAKRMLMNVVEDTLDEVCKWRSEQGIPLFFLEHCIHFAKYRRVVRDGLYLGLMIPQICKNADFCGAISYFGKETSIHNPLRTVYFNGGRGTCGFTKGWRARTGMMTNMGCVAGSILLNEFRFVKPFMISEEAVNANSQARL